MEVAAEEGEAAEGQRQPVAARSQKPEASEGSQGSYIEASIVNAAPQPGWAVHCQAGCCFACTQPQKGLRLQLAQPQNAQQIVEDFNALDVFSCS